jgi:ParB-like chromosome segregation protein Spo0J
MLPVSEIIFTDWNCNEMSEEQLAELLADIKNEECPEDPHFDEPIQVVPVDATGGKKYMVLGGEHRTKIMRALNQEHIPAVIRHDLVGLSRHELMMWSVRRNHHKGKINAQKYAEMEAEIIDKGKMTAEAARRQMLINGDLAKALRASVSVRANEDGSSDDGHQGARQHDPDATDTPDPRSKAELLQTLKMVEQDVLLDSADTVDHGYLFFAQGKNGQTHLVVDSSEALHKLVKQMVKLCKGNDAKVDDFLSAAIRNELGNWE